uniref:Uncharacterized protein n=1 Tax=Arundo donax TaxID=35708 RepID=A0A0A8Y9J8_ARUDO
MSNHPKSRTGVNAARCVFKSRFGRRRW